MTVKLEDLSACFEGVIPSVVATAAADGTPNVSYLSHVVMVDENRVALSNQFFAKTAANVRANPQTSLLLVDGVTGQQYALDLQWEASLDRGELFDRVARDLRASSVQIGLADLMRLKAVDIFQVLSIRPCPAPVLPDEAEEQVGSPGMREMAEAARAIAVHASTEEILDALLESASMLAGCNHAVVLLHERERDVLVTVAAVGYAQAGTGSEVPLREGLIGEAAAGRETLKLNDLSRVRRFSAAIVGGDSEGDTRTIPFPHAAEALSQIAIPMIVQGTLTGVLFLESPRRLAFNREMEAALETLAGQAASALALAEVAPARTHIAELEPSVAPSNSSIQVVSYAFDDSVFIDGRYVIKGVAGRLLVFLLEHAVSDGRTEFTNREIRRAAELRLPDFKDNLETRLLLLRRRLEEKQFPVRLERAGRGRMKLKMMGVPRIERRP
ncbi:GAF domain-containing protein [Altericroceibacterium xinjiangense]|uniref:GAF domain-containing protein n=1 Tax=Altericroceibacterium xinjiangense TaxID=762261 RepID=UPI000F7F3303|nr:GAF domain-containing protein [Altericroceibacterium xinjiangense]